MIAGMEVKMYRQSEKTTAIYCRVDYPGSPEAIQSQIWAALDFVYQNHLEPAVCFVDDGYPGMAPDRPGLQSMVRRIMAGATRTVVVKSLDRLMRDSFLFQDFAEQVLTPGGVPLYTISDGDSLTGKSMAAITGALLRAEKGGLA